MSFGEGWVSPFGVHPGQAEWTEVGAWRRDGILRTDQLITVLCLALVLPSPRPPTLPTPTPTPPPLSTLAWKSLFHIASSQLLPPCYLCGQRSSAQTWREGAEPSSPAWK